MGQNWKVDEVVAVDAKNVKVRLGEENRIISRDDLAHFVAAEHLKRSPLEVASADLEQLIRQAIIINDKEGLALVLSAVLREASLSDDQLAAILTEDTQFNLAAVGQSLLVQQGKYAAYPKSSAVLAYAVALESPEWLRAKAASHLYAVREELREVLVTQYRGALAAGKLENGNDILRAALGVMGRSDKVSKQLLVAEDNLTRIRKAAIAVQPDDLYPLIDLVRRDPALAGLISSPITRELMNAAAKALSEHGTDRASQLISLISLDWRTPRTHELARKILELGGPSAYPLFVDGRVGAFYAALAGKDELLKIRYLEVLEAVFRRNIESRTLRGVDEIFAKVTNLRSDPNTDNDQLRVAWIVALQSTDLQSKASQIFSEIQTGLGVVSQYRLFRAGMYGSPSWLILGGALVILLSLTLLYRVVYISSDPEVQRERGYTAGVSIFARVGMKGVDPKFQEYRRGLKLLDLEADADLQTIKQAYRSAVKEVHPDLHGQLDPEKNNKFIELTRVYERLLVLRKELQLDKK